MAFRQNSTKDVPLSPSARVHSTQTSVNLKSSRCPHPKSLASQRLGGVCLESLAREITAGITLENEEIAAASGRTINVELETKCLTRNKKALSVTPNIFNQMRASMSLSPDVLSNLFMNREKTGNVVQYCFFRLLFIVYFLYYLFTIVCNCLYYIARVQSLLD